MRGGKFGFIYGTNSNTSLEQENQVGHGLKMGWSAIVEVKR